jgi:hypothetical protein
MSARLGRAHPLARPPPSTDVAPPPRTLPVPGLHPAPERSTSRAKGQYPSHPARRTSSTSPTDTPAHGPAHTACPYGRSGTTRRQRGSAQSGASAPRLDPHSGHRCPIRASCRRAPDPGIPSPAPIRTTEPAPQSARPGRHVPSDAARCRPTLPLHPAPRPFPAFIQTQNGPLRGANGQYPSHPARRTSTTSPTDTPDRHAPDGVSVREVGPPRRHFPYRHAAYGAAGRRVCTGSAR